MAVAGVSANRLELLTIADAVAREKNIDKEIVVEAIEEGRVKPGGRILLPAFGAGLTFCAHFVRWGERVTPKGTTDVELPPCEKTALEMVKEQIRKRETTSVSH